MGAPVTPVMRGYVPPHLSASQVVQYLRCPASYYWSRVENVWLPANAAMLFGSSVHFGLEAYHRGKNPYAAFSKHWLAARRTMDEAGIAYSNGYSTAGPALLSLYEDDPLPDGQPERRHTVRLPGVPVPIMLVFDLEGDGWVGEHKTAGWSWGEGRVEEEFQGALYRVAYPLIAKRPLEHLTYTILSCNPSPSLERYVLLPNPEQVVKVVDTCNVVLASMAAGVWTPRCPPSQCNYPGESFCPLLRATQQARTSSERVQEVSSAL